MKLLAKCCVLLRIVGVNPSELLKLAKSAPEKSSLEAHRDAILVLRDKGYTWREIALFLSEKGVSADHTSVYRLVTKPRAIKPKMNTTITIPPAASYVKALSSLTIHPNYRKMLKAHYLAHNRSITYTELNKAAGYKEGNDGANLQYGIFGGMLGDALGFKFDEFSTAPGTEFRSSAIGMPNNYTSGEFQLIMHHELAKALQELAWF